MLKIKYTVSLRDLILFNTYASVFIFPLNIIYLVYSICLLAEGFRLYMKYGNGILDLLIMLAIMFAGILALLFIFLFLFCLVFAVANLMKGLKGIVGGHDLDLDDEWVSEKTDYNESKIYYKSISRYWETHWWLIAQITLVQYILIPKNQLTAEELAGFKEILDSKLG